tara:strand:- start:491 stop:1660 length:1170 start_codon:yes stop_codon:yes gene_type:complete
MSKNHNDIVITSAVRSPIGSYKGGLKDLKADQIGSECIKHAIKKSKIKPEDIDEIIMGQVLTSGQGQNPARQAAINANIPNSKPAHLVNQVCGSGLRSIISGYQQITLNDANIIISGGQENMSRSHHSIYYRIKKELNKENLLDTMINDGLIDAFNNYHMGITAENVAKKFNVSRENQDEFAFDSQMKTLNAIKNKKFENEIIKIENSNLIEDEYPKKDITIEDLKNFDPVFKDGGSVTAGNSSGLNDGAAAVVLMKRSDAENRGLQPLAKIKCWSNTGVDPSIMGIGPISAINLATKKANWKIKDVDLFEINEAFAAQSIAVINELKLPIDKVNVNGGAIALGHPIGASGTRIVVTLLHEMIKRDSKKGVASLCVGGGMGIALCIERD